MANSFNISVKPEIAAVSALVTTVDGVVDLIRSDDVPAIKSNTNANETKIDANKTVLDLIHGTDVVNIQTNIDSNETKIDDNKTSIDAIQPVPYYWMTESDTLVQSADTERTNSTTSYILVKSIRIFFSGIYRIKFDLKGNNTAEFSGRIYKNGVAHGTEQMTTSTSYVNYSEDLVFAADDLIQLYIRTNYVGRNVDTRNFRLYGTIITTTTLIVTD